MTKKLYQIDTDDAELDLNDQLSGQASSRLGANNSTNQFHVARKHRFFWPLLIISLAIVFFVANYWYSSVKNSLLADQLPDFIKAQILDNGEDQDQTIAELKNKDTDQDGLTDFVELYQYHTSIFLDDSDSDGISDNTEVVKGDDPLCPFGQECSLLKLITPDTKLANILKDISLNKDLSLEQATANEFRKFLIDNGMTEEELAALSDEDLLSILAIVAESDIVASDAWTKDTTPEQIKNFLLSQPGADANKINNMSEAELIAIRDQLIGNQ